MEQLSAFSISNLPDFKKIGAGKMKLLPIDAVWLCCQVWQLCVKQHMCLLSTHKVLVTCRQL